ncbi:ABC transporter substrate-binding protein [Candidatus Bipolaricaulota bacterium]|nr:ABC transporter substrate-binding protein [Candidatus Bipolaricaulota bacterium]
MRRLAMLLVVGCLIAAGAMALAEEPRYGGVLRAAMQTNPPTLDPHKTTTTATQQIACHVFEPLVAFDENFAPQPVLLASWEAAEDNLSYTLHLRTGVKFHNGKLLTAEDVKASLERIIAISPVSGYYDGVTEIDVVDDHTLQVRLSKPMNLVAAMTVQVTWQGIMPKEFAENHDELRVGQLIGTGPYKLVEWRPDVYVKLVRFPDYVPVEAPASGFVGKKVAYLDEILFIPVKEVGARIAGLETGEYDYAEALPIETLKTIQANRNLVPQIVKPQWALVWELNGKEWPTSNAKFRQALLAALDMEFVVSTVVMNDPNFYSVNPGFIFGPWSAWYTEAGKEHYNQANLERARQLLKEAGYNGEDVVLLSNRDYYWMYRCTLAAAACLERAGIRVKIEFSDWPSQIGKALTLKGWNINQTGWSPNEDPVRTKGSLLCGAPYAYGYCNPKMDQLLDQISRPASFEERKEIWEQIQLLYYDDVPVIFFGYIFGLDATRAEVQDYRPWYVVPRFWNVWKRG